MQTTRTDSAGVSSAISAYALWGILPLYWQLLKQVPSLQIISHRMLWCCISVCAYLLITRGKKSIIEIFKQPKLLAALALCSLLISSNWGIYIWAINQGHVIDASLGYFINPLVSVLFGVFLLREKLNRIQWLSIAIAAFGVLWLTWQYGKVPWIALSLAVSFAIYGLIRKIIAVDAIVGLAIESLLLCIPAILYLLFAHRTHNGAFLEINRHTDILLMLAGPLTALPLIGYAFAAKRIDYSLLGILQYISPSLQLLCGVFILHEAFPAKQAIGFACIWLALAIYVIDSTVTKKSH